MEYPLINMVIDDHEETGVEAIAFVDHPAIEREWLAFNNQKQQTFAVQSEEKRIVTGALMVANLPIYRRDEHIGEYYVKFDPDTIMQIAQRFMKNKMTSNVNLDHETAVEGVYMFESFIIDERKRTPEGFAKLPNGSWFGSFKVDNDEVWAKVKDGTFKGFSIEGIFTDAATKQLDEQLIKEVERLIQGG